MATNEASFKREFRKALEVAYPEATIWTNNDMFRVGLPDFSALWKGTFFAIEAKFVKAPPVRDTSLVLGHELSETQALFLNNVSNKSGGKGVVLLGFEDIAVGVPFTLWSSAETHAGNITLSRIRMLKDQDLAFPKIKGRWNVSTFFEKMNGRLSL